MPAALENPSRELEVTSRSVQRLVLDGFKGVSLNFLSLSLSLPLFLFLSRTGQKIYELVCTHENGVRLQPRKCILENERELVRWLPSLERGERGNNKLHGFILFI